MKKRDYPGLLPAALAALLLVANQAFGDSYELAKVKGMEAFNGSAGAKDLLSKNGFVVADPRFKQIFEAYIKSPPVERPSEKNPRGSVLPWGSVPRRSCRALHEDLTGRGFLPLVPPTRARALPYTRSMATLATLKPEAISVQPGGEAECELTIRNTGRIVDQFSFEALGSAAPWTSFEPSTVLLAGGAETLTEVPKS